MINIEKKFIFTHPQKCAGSSIEEALKAILKLTNEQYYENLNRHAPLRKEIKAINSLGLHEKDFFKFSCIRNPWDRMVSMYYHILKFDIEIYRERGDSHEALLKYYEKVKNMSFSEFCEFQETADIKQLSPTKVFMYYENAYKIDFVIRYENLKIDFEHCLKVLNLETIELPNVYRDYRPKDLEYKSLYNEKTRKIIERQFEFDIDFFGYTF
jgi:hypothetical protein